MGTTLTNGIYLPNEGEKNCYAGLKTNWETLDQKIADIAALQQAVAGALHREIVESLPTTDIDPNTIYMILSGTSATENVYNEFMYVNNAWELIGTSATDLTNYYTKGDVDGLLLLKANASDLTSHTGDTTIHVTTADKNRWNNNTYVFRYSSTALTPSSTNSNTLLDNTDNLKVGDKVIDSSGVLFSITAIDTVNSTFTVGSALIDLALDSDVVTAQGTATSAQNTATLARGQAYVVRYANVAVSDNSTVPYANLNNIDNIKVNDLLLDTNGKFYQITAVDTANETVSVTTPLTQLAVDSNVMHLSGNETVAGQKTFSNMSSFQGSYLGNESSTNERTNFYLRSNRDTADKSGAYISRFRPNKNQGGLVGSDNSFISISFLENETRYIRCFDFGLTDWDSDGIPQTYYFTSPSGKGALGTSSRKWQLINGIEPSSLSLPSGNTADRVDISSYITAFDGTTNSYTPPANGWLSISVDNSTEVYVFLKNLYGVNNSRPTAGNIRVTLPVLKGIAVAIRITNGTLNFARFIPCQGNV